MVQDSLLPTGRVHWVNHSGLRPIGWVWLVCNTDKIIISILSGTLCQVSQLQSCDSFSGGSVESSYHITVVLLWQLTENNNHDKSNNNSNESGGGDGSPPQHSCLENAMERGTCQAQSIGLQSQTGVKQLITVQHSPRRTKENWDFQGSSVTQFSRTLRIFHSVIISNQLSNWLRDKNPQILWS